MVLKIFKRALAILSEPPSPTAPRHLPTLDGIRGLAALIVFVSHAANLGFLPSILGGGAGKLGVAMFFILSGFLMSYLYGDDVFGRDSVSRYWRHRLARVLPLYFLVVITSIGISGAAGLWIFPIDDAQSILVHMFMIHGVNTLWTIPVEVHFYLAFIFIWWMASQRRLVAGLIIVQVAAAGLALGLLGRTDTYVIWFWIHLFLLGATVGMLWKRRHVQLTALRTRWWAQALGWVSLGAVVLAFPKVRAALGAPVLPEWADPLIVGSAAAFLLAMLVEVGPSAWMKHRFMVWMGSISYGFYLIHYPVLRTLELHFQPTSTMSGLGLALLGLGVTALISQVSLMMFERPVQKLVAKAGVRTAGASMPKQDRIG